MTNIEEFFEKYVKKIEGKNILLKKKLKELDEEIKTQPELFKRLKYNWGKVNPSKVNDKDLKLESLKDRNKYWVELSLSDPAVEKIQEINFLLGRGKTKYGKNPENYSNSKKLKIKKAYESFHPYYIKLEDRKLNSREWAYFTYTPKKRIWKELFNGELIEYLVKNRKHRF